MSLPRPEFHLRHIHDDGAAGPLEVYQLASLPVCTKMARRGFLGIGLGTASLGTLWQQARAAENGSNSPASSGRRRPLSRTATVRAHIDCVRALVITPDGQTLASAAVDGTIKLWSLPDGKLRRKIFGPGLAVQTLALNDDGTMLASGSADSSIRLWSLPSGQASGDLSGLKAPVNLVAITPDGGNLVSISADGKIVLWKIPQGVVTRSYRGIKDAIGLLELWNVPQSVQDQLIKSSRVITAFLIATGAQFLATGTSGGRAQVWALPSGDETHDVMPHHSRIYSLHMTPDAELLATASMDRSVKIFDLATGQVLHTLRDFPSWTITVALDAKGKTLATGHADGTIMLWEVATGELLGYCFDPQASQTDGTSFHIADSTTSRTLTYTMPCGSPIPSGATCICNCVPGTYRPPTYRINPPTVRLAPPQVRMMPPGMRTQSRCACVPVCTCVPVFR